MTIGELVVKIAADTSAMRRDLAAARTQIEGFAASTRGASRDIDHMGKSTDSLGGDVKRARGEFDKWESHIPIIGGMLDGMNRSLVKATGGLLGFIPGMSGVGQSIQNASPMLAAFLSWGEAIPAALFAALFAVNALADGMGTLLAIVGDLIAPLGVLAGLLGGLGLGFVLAGKRALDGGKQFSQLHHVVDQVKSKFQDLTTTLAHRFMPIFMQLGHDAEHALDFLGRIAKLPLNDAFRKLAQQGIPAIQKFLDQVGGMVAKPIRLAFQIAFGTGKAGGEASSFVSNLWNQLERFWLGYTKTKTLRFGNGRVLQITQQQVQGALAPFIDWFNRHNFTAQGEKIGHQLMGGLSKLRGPIGQFLISVIEDAGKQAARQTWEAFKSLAKQALDWLKNHAGAVLTFIATGLSPKMWHAMWGSFKNLAGQAWNYLRSHASSILGDIAGWVRSKVGQAWNATKSAAGSAWHYVRNLAGGILSSIGSWISGKVAGAWQSVKNAASKVWNWIKSTFEQALSVHINWPSPPSWLSNVGGFIKKHTATGGFLAPHQATVVGERGPELFVPAGAGTIVPNHRSGYAGGRGGGDTYLVFPNVVGLDRQAARQLARDIQPHLGRQVILKTR